METGYIQVYTGSGKGKTTAALGLALRCLCAGNRVFFGQFMKGRETSEQKAPAYLPGLTMEQFGAFHFVGGAPSEEDRRQGQAGLVRMKEVLQSGEYDLVIFDEINTALAYEIVTLEQFAEVLQCRLPQTEVVLTGRGAPDAVLRCADLVTEMKEIKHYYNSGVPARVGIEE